MISLTSTIAPAASVNVGDMSSKSRLHKIIIESISNYRYIRIDRLINK